MEREVVRGLLMNTYIPLHEKGPMEEAKFSTENMTRSNVTEERTNLAELLIIRVMGWFLGVEK